MQETEPLVTPGLLLDAYARGYFPMAETRDDPKLFWLRPELRGVFPLGGFRISRSLARRLRQGQYLATLSQDFAGVIDGCAGRAETWISHRLRGLYLDLHRMGAAHSVEIWMEDQLVGGVYGVTLGGGFFGESMFSRRTDASKLALAHLIEHLNHQGFQLFDTQFLTPHLASLGAVEIPRSRYLKQLAAAITVPAQFAPTRLLPKGDDVLRRHGVMQRSTQVS